MTRARKRKRKSAGVIPGILLGLLGLTLIGAMVGAAYWVRATTVALDSANCPPGPPKRIHVVIIDRSDPITELQAQRVRQVLDAAKASAPTGMRFDVYTFEGDLQNEMRPAISLCVPQRPDAANPLYENQRRIRKRYEEQFTAAIDNVVNALLAATNRDNSPILESLRAAAQTSLGGLPGDGSTPVHFTLVSDMVQHTPLHSQFKTDMSFEALSKSNQWSQLRPNLHGADVEILYLLRPLARRAGNPIQSRGHQMFWEQLVQAANGRVTRIEPL